MIGRLLCAVGSHAPEPDGLWNAGYCFTRCRRCGCDMVRSAFGEWHVPRGHRIAWHPPGNGRTHQVPMAAEPVARPAPPRRVAPAGGMRRNATDRGDPFDFAEFDEPRPPRAPAARPPGIPAAG